MTLNAFVLFKMSENLVLSLALFFVSLSLQFVTLNSHKPSPGVNYFELILTFAIIFYSYTILGLNAVTIRRLLFVKEVDIADIKADTDTMF